MKAFHEPVLPRAAQFDIDCVAPLGSQPVRHGIQYLFWVDDFEQPVPSNGLGC